MRRLILSALAIFAMLAPAQAQEKKPMKETIAVIGTGRMGGAFGGTLAALGHPIVYGSRDAAKPAVQELLSKSTGAKADTPKAAAAAAQIIVLAVPWTGAEESIKALGDLSGKIVIDATNALNFTKGGMEMAVPTSAGEIIQGWLPNAKVVKAFNTVGFFVIANPKVTSEGPVAVFLASNDDGAKTRVRDLVTAMGFHPVDVGGIKNARSLEAMSILYMVPYLGGKPADAFEWAVRDTGGKASGKVRPAQ